MLIAFLYKHYGISNFISLGFCNVILGIFLSKKIRNSKKGDGNIVYIHSLWFTFSFGLLISVFRL